VRFAARIDPDLLALIHHLVKNTDLSIAEINRRVGTRADALGRHRPSYAGVRLLVGDVRMYPDEPSWARLLWNVNTRVDHPDVLVDKYVGLIATKNLPEDHGIR
jgi:hypothetical protein